MRNLLVALFVLVALAGCLSIPKPDWNPGTTAPAPQTAAERPTCTLPAQWVWVENHKNWLCMAVPSYVYEPPVYYWPTIIYCPVRYGPPQYHRHYCHRYLYHTDPSFDDFMDSLLP